MSFLKCAKTHAKNLLTGSMLRQHNTSIEMQTERHEMTRSLHLNKSGSGMASKTACGRNLLRTPMSGNWEEFIKQSKEVRCELCAASKFATLMMRRDMEQFIAGDWEPVADPDAWKAADDALIAAYRARKAAK